MASEPLLGQTTSLGSLCFSLGMVWPHARMEIHPWNQVKKRRTKVIQHCVTLDLIQSKNVWPLRSQSAHSRVSAVLFYARTTKFVWAQICVSNVHVSRPQAKGRQHHLSQTIGTAIAGSARPAPTALLERNECVKETVPLKLFKVQSSNFKMLTQKWCSQGRPSRPACNGND